METLDELQIGWGHYGDVFLRQTENSKMAVKKMIVKNEALRRSYQKECEVLAKVSHPNVVSYIGTREIGNVGSNLFEIMMEYCERGSLEKVVFNPQIIYSMKTIISWMECLFDALNHLFQRHRIVHRDIKPHNIFVKEDFTLKIGDFGIAKESEATQAGTEIGTECYMAPPQIVDCQNDSKAEKEFIHQVCHKNDVYGMGLVFWELIERRQIFSAYNEGKFNQLRFYLDVLIKPFLEIEPLTCHQDSIKLLVESCTNFDRSQRFTASKMVERLKNMLGTEEYLDDYEYLPIVDTNQKLLLKPIGFDNSKAPIPVISETFTTIPSISFGSNSRASSSSQVSTNSGAAYLRSLKLIRQDFGTLSEKFLELPEDEKLHLTRNFPRLISEILMETKVFHKYQHFKEKADLLEKSAEIPELIQGILYSDLYRQGKWLEEALLKLEAYYNARSFSAKDRYQRINAFIKGFEHIKAEKFELYTARFHFQAFFSLDRRKEWLLVNEEKKMFVKKDLSQCKIFAGEWKEDRGKLCFINKRQTFDQYQKRMIERNEEMRPSGLQPIDLYMVIDAFKRERENVLKLGTFDQEKRVPLEALEEMGELFSDCKLGLKLPIRGYIFQLRNPPRLQCHHQPKCPIIIDPRDEESPSEIQIPYYECTNERAHLYLADDRNFCDVIGAILDDKGYKITETSLGYRREYTAMNGIHIIHHSYLCFIQVPNLLQKEEQKMLILLDHPRNYRDDEFVPAFDYEMNYYELPAVHLNEFLNDLQPNERTFARIGNRFNFKVVDNNGHLMTPKLLKRTWEKRGEKSVAGNRKKSK